MNLSALRNAVRRKLVQNIAAGAYGKLVQFAVQLASVPIMLSHWGVQVYGVWLLLYAVPGYLVISDFGLASAGTNEMVSLVAQDRGEEAGRLYFVLSRLALIATATLGATAALVIALLGHDVFAFAMSATGGHPRLATIALVAYGLLALSNQVTMGALSADDRHAAGLMIFQSMALAESGAAVVVVVCGGNVLLAAVICLLVRVPGSVASYWWMRRNAEWISRNRSPVRLRDLRGIVRPGLAVFLLSMAGVTTFNGSTLALGSTAGPSAVPLFNVPRVATRFALQLAILVSVASIPRLTIAHARDSGQGKALLTVINLIASFAITVPAAIGLLLFGSPLISVWTAGHVVPGSSLMIPLVLSMILSGFWLPLSNLLFAINRHESYAYFYLGAAVICVVGGSLLATIYGALAMAWAMALLDLMLAIWIAAVVARQKLVTAADFATVREIIDPHLPVRFRRAGKERGVNGV